MIWSGSNINITGTQISFFANNELNGEYKYYPSNSRFLLVQILFCNLLPASIIFIIILLRENICRISNEISYGIILMITGYVRTYKELQGNREGLFAYLYHIRKHHHNLAIWRYKENIFYLRSRYEIIVNYNRNFNNQSNFNNKVIT